MGNAKNKKEHDTIAKNNKTQEKRTTHEQSIVNVAHQKPLEKLITRVRNHAYQGPTRIHLIKNLIKNLMET